MDVASKAGPVLSGLTVILEAHTIYNEMNVTDEEVNKKFNEKLQAMKEFVVQVNNIYKLSE
jgi:hypothetical protein